MYFNRDAYRNLVSKKEYTSGIEERLSFDAHTAVKSFDIPITLNHKTQERTYGQVDKTSAVQSLPSDKETFQDVHVERLERKTTKVRDRRSDTSHYPRSRYTTAMQYEDPYCDALAQVKALKTKPLSFVVLGPTHVLTTGVAKQLSFKYGSVLLEPRTIMSEHFWYDGLDDENGVYVVRNPDLGYKPSDSEDVNGQYSTSESIRFPVIDLIDLYKSRLNREDVRARGYIATGLQYLLIQDPERGYELFREIFSSEHRPDFLIFVPGTKEDVSQAYEYYAVLPFSEFEMFETHHTYISDKVEHMRELNPVFDPRQNFWFLLGKRINVFEACLWQYMDLVDYQQHMKKRAKDLGQLPKASQVPEMINASLYFDDKILLEELTFYYETAWILEKYVKQMDSQFVMRLDASMPPFFMFSNVLSRIFSLPLINVTPPKYGMSLNLAKKLEDVAKETKPGATEDKEKVFTGARKVLGMIADLPVSITRRSRPSFVRDSIADEGRSSLIRFALEKPLEAMTEAMGELEGEGEGEGELEAEGEMEEGEEGDTALLKLLKSLRSEEVVIFKRRQKRKKHYYYIPYSERQATYPAALSEWQRRCPVSFYDGFIKQGKNDHVIRVHDKLYFTENLDAMDRFLTNPSKYLIPPLPTSTCRVIVCGHPIAGKTYVAEALAAFFDTAVVDYNQLKTKALEMKGHFNFEDALDRAEDLAFNTVNAEMWNDYVEQEEFGFDQFCRWILKVYRAVHYRAIVQPPGEFYVEPRKHGKKSAKLFAKTLHDIRERSPPNISLEKFFGYLKISFDDREILVEKYQQAIDLLAYYVNTMDVEENLPEGSTILEKTSTARQIFHDNRMNFFGSHDICKYYYEDPLRILEFCPDTIWPKNPPEEIPVDDARVKYVAYEILKKLQPKEVAMTAREEANLILEAVYQIENEQRGNGLHFGGWVIDGVIMYPKLWEYLCEANLMAQVVYMADPAMEYYWSKNWTDYYANPSMRIREIINELKIYARPVRPKLDKEEGLLKQIYAEGFHVKALNLNVARSWYQKIEYSSKSDDHSDIYRGRVRFLTRNEHRFYGKVDRQKLDDLEGSHSEVSEHLEMIVMQSNFERRTLKTDQRKTGVLVDLKDFPKFKYNPMDNINVIEQLTSSPAEVEMNFQYHFKRHKINDQLLEKTISEGMLNSENLIIKTVGIAGPRQLIHDLLNDIRGFGCPRLVSDFSTNQPLLELDDRVSTRPATSIHKFYNLDHYCIVDLLDGGQLIKGQHLVVFMNKMYTLCSTYCYRRFLMNPETYSTYFKPSHALPELRISVLGIRGSGADQVAKIVADYLGLRYIDFEKHFQARCIPSGLLPLGDGVENPFNTASFEYFPKYFHRRKKLKSMIEEIRDYLNLQGGKMPLRTWKQVGSSTWNVPGFVYHRMPYNVRDFARIHRYASVPEVIIHVRLFFHFRDLITSDSSLTEFQLPSLDHEKLKWTTEEEPYAFEPITPEFYPGVVVKEQSSKERLVKARNFSELTFELKSADSSDFSEETASYFEPFNKRDDISSETIESFVSQAPSVISCDTIKSDLIVDGKYTCPCEGDRGPLVDLSKMDYFEYRQSDAQSKQTAHEKAKTFLAFTERALKKVAMSDQVLDEMFDILAKWSHHRKDHKIASRNKRALLYVKECPNNDDNTGFKISYLEGTSYKNNSVIMNMLKTRNIDDRRIVKAARGLKTSRISDFELVRRRKKLIEIHPILEYANRAMQKSVKSIERIYYKKVLKRVLDHEFSIGDSLTKYPARIRAKSFDHIRKGLLALAVKKAIDKVMELLNLKLFFNRVKFNTPVYASESQISFASIRSDSHMNIFRTVGFNRKSLNNAINLSVKVALRCREDKIPELSSQQETRLEGLMTEFVGKFKRHFMTEFQEKYLEWRRERKSEFIKKKGRKRKRFTVVERGVPSRLVLREVRTTRVDWPSSLVKRIANLAMRFERLVQLFPLIREYLDQAFPKKIPLKGLRAMRIQKKTVLRAIISHSKRELDKIKEIKAAAAMMDVPFINFKPRVTDFRLLLQLLSLPRVPPGEDVYEINYNDAEIFLDQGIFYLSRFGRRCPVLLYGRKDPEIHPPLDWPTICIAHRRFIYFLSSRTAVNLFALNPMKYILQNPTYNVVAPVKVLIIGPESTRRLKVAKALAQKFGLHVMTINDVLMYALGEMPWSGLSDDIGRECERGKGVTPYLVIRALQAAVQVPRAINQGWVLVGLIPSVEVVSLMVEFNLVPHITVSVEAEDMNYYKINLDRRRLLHEYNMEKRYYYFEEIYRPLMDEWDTERCKQGVNALKRISLFYKRIVNNANPLSTSRIIIKFISQIYNILVIYHKRKNDGETYATPFSILRSAAEEEFEHSAKREKENFCVICAQRHGIVTDGQDAILSGVYVEIKKKKYWVCEKHFPELTVLPNPTRSLNLREEKHDVSAVKIDCVRNLFGITKYIGCAGCYLKRPFESFFQHDRYNLPTEKCYLVRYFNNYFVVCSEECCKKLVRYSATMKYLKIIDTLGSNKDRREDAKITEYYRAVEERTMQRVLPPVFTSAGDFLLENKNSLPWWLCPKIPESHMIVTHAQLRDRLVSVTDRSESRQNDETRAELDSPSKVAVSTNDPEGLFEDENYICPSQLLQDWFEVHGEDGEDPVRIHQKAVAEFKRRTLEVDPFRDVLVNPKKLRLKSCCRSVVCKCGQPAKTVATQQTEKVVIYAEDAISEKIEEAVNESVRMRLKMRTALYTNRTSEDSIMSQLKICKPVWKEGNCVMCSWHSYGKRIDERIFDWQLTKMCGDDHCPCFLHKIKTCTDLRCDCDLHKTEHVCNDVSCTCNLHDSGLCKDPECTCWYHYSVKCTDENCECRKHLRRKCSNVDCPCWGHFKRECPIHARLCNNKKCGCRAHTFFKCTHPSCCKDVCDLNCPCTSHAVPRCVDSECKCPLHKSDKEMNCPGCRTYYKCNNPSCECASHDEIHCVHLWCTCIEHRIPFCFFPSCYCSKHSSDRPCVESECLCPHHVIRRCEDRWCECRRHDEIACENSDCPCSIHEKLTCFFVALVRNPCNDTSCGCKDFSQYNFSNFVNREDFGWFEAVRGKILRMRSSFENMIYSNKKPVEMKCKMNLNFSVNRILCEGCTNRVNRVYANLKIQNEGNTYDLNRSSSKQTYDSSEASSQKPIRRKRAFYKGKVCAVSGVQCDKERCDCQSTNSSSFTSMELVPTDEVEKSPLSTDQSCLCCVDSLTSQLSADISRSYPRCTRLSCDMFTHSQHSTVPINKCICGEGSKILSRFKLKFNQKVTFSLLAKLKSKAGDECVVKYSLRPLGLDRLKRMLRGASPQRHHHHHHHHMRSWANLIFKCKSWSAGPQRGESIRQIPDIMLLKTDERGSSTNITRGLSDTNLLGSNAAERATSEGMSTRSSSQQHSDQQSVGKSKRSTKTFQDVSDIEINALSSQMDLILKSEMTHLPRRYSRKTTEERSRQYKEDEQVTKFLVSLHKESCSSILCSKDRHFITRGEFEDRKKVKFEQEEDEGELMSNLKRRKSGKQKSFDQGKTSLERAAVLSLRFENEANATVVKIPAKLLRSKFIAKKRCYTNLNEVVKYLAEERYRHHPSTCTHLSRIPLYDTKNKAFYDLAHEGKFFRSFPVTDAYYRRGDLSNFTKPSDRNEIPVARVTMTDIFISNTTEMPRLTKQELVPAEGSLSLTRLSPDQRGIESEILTDRVKAIYTKIMEIHLRNRDYVDSWNKMFDVVKEWDPNKPILWKYEIEAWKLDVNEWKITVETSRKLLERIFANTRHEALDHLEVDRRVTDLNTQMDSEMKSIANAFRLLPSSRGAVSREIHMLGYREDRGKTPEGYAQWWPILSEIKKNTPIRIFLAEGANLEDSGRMFMDCYRWFKADYLKTEIMNFNRTKKRIAAEKLPKPEVKLPSEKPPKQKRATFMYAAERVAHEAEMFKKGTLELEKHLINEKVKIVSDLLDGKRQLQKTLHYAQESTVSKLSKVIRDKCEDILRNLEQIDSALLELTGENFDGMVGAFGSRRSRKKLKKQRESIQTVEASEGELFKNEEKTDEPLRPRRVALTRAEEKEMIKKLMERFRKPNLSWFTKVKTITAQTFLTKSPEEIWNDINSGRI